MVMVSKFTPPGRGMVSKFTLPGLGMPDRVISKFTPPGLVISLHCQQVYTARPGHGQ